MHCIADRQEPPTGTYLRWADVADVVVVLVDLRRHYSNPPLLAYPIPSVILEGVHWRTVAKVIADPSG
jgi:hypothetical protein